MYVLTVELKIRPEHVESFRESILRQAQTTLANEADCLRFDVATSEADPHTFLLYEIYTDRAAFDRHASMPYSKESGARTKPWIVQSQIRIWVKQQ